MVKIKLEDSRTEPLLHIKKKPKEKPQKLRSLVVREDVKDLTKKRKLIKNTQTSRWQTFKTIVVTATLVVMLAIGLHYFKLNECSFWSSYDRNLNSILHGDANYCRHEFNTSFLIEKLTERLVAQDDAVLLISGALRAAVRDKFVSVAIFGSIGVGKTLAANIMMDHFQWDSNVQNFIWEVDFRMDLDGPEAYASDFDEISTELSTCGFNLVVIDDVNTKNSSIERIEKLERKVRQAAKDQGTKIIFIAIFQGPSNDELVTYLSNFVTIDFQSFTKTAFEECIKLHQRQFNITLMLKDYEELMTIDYNKTGCKTIVKKLNSIRIPNK